VDLDFKIILDWWPLILDGFKLTLVIVTGAILLGIPLGGLLAFGRQSRFKTISISATAFIELFRNTPFMIQVFLLFYVLPFYGIRIPANIVGIIGLALFGSVYYAEIIRAGIDAIPRGQLESARSIGMSHWQSMTNIVLPQTMRIILPPIGNQTLSLVKESSILSTITVQELTMSALIVQGQTFRPFEIFIVITLLYWGVNELIATGLRIYERRLKRRSTLVLAGTSSNERLS
jgi:His/Glu/Gln/Arg/opine family amino acid ABC transporter permease subunit